MIEDDSSPAPSDPGPGPRDPYPSPTHRYERQGLLGKGGMGRVYAARDNLLHRQVALKIAATPELANRLAREAWITAQLEHPGIVAVYDAGETEGQAWYTMRLIRGKTLRDRLSACKDAAERLALLPHFYAACQAVAYAHSMGIVHRDLKPSNIMVGEFGETQVADWGLATPIDDALPDWQRIVAPAGHASGTPRYMSPEQASGASASFSADVFGLGVVLVELLAGVSDSGTPPSLGGVPDSAPRELVAIAHRCLRDAPSERYATAKELADDVGRWLSGRRVLAHEYRPVELLARLIRIWRVPLAVGSVALIAVAVTVAIGVKRTARERAVAEANLAVALTKQALTALLDERLPEAYVLAANVLAYGPSPEARGILAATRRNGAELVWSVPLPEMCRHSATLSPDTTQLACFGDGKLSIWQVEPLQQRLTLDIHAVEGPVWVGAALLVATSTHASWILDGKIEPAVQGQAWWPLAAGDGAFLVRGPDARYARPDGSVAQFAICTATRPTTTVVHGQLAVGCDDGTLRSYAPDGTLTLELPLGERPHWSAVRQTESGLLIGRLDGGVQRLSLPEGGLSAPLPGLSNSVRGLLSVPGTASVLVLGERGGPRIWNTAAEGWAGSLPAGASRMFAGNGVGEAILLGDGLQLWRVAGTPRPTVLSFATGVSQVVPSPTGRELAVALGGGEIVERRLSDGLELRRWGWFPGVAKCVAYGADGLLVAGAMGGPGRVLGPGPEMRPLAAAQVLRRAGSASDGRVWVVDYGGNAAWVDRGGSVVTVQTLQSTPFDGSSSPSGDAVALLDPRGGIWLAEGSAWREAGVMTDAAAVDIGDGGSPLVIARRREICVDKRCHPVEDDVLDVAFDGRRIALATLSGDVQLMDAANGRVVAVLRGHSARVSSVEFGPDGEWLVSGSWDGTARIWDLGGLDEPAAELILRGERAWGLSLDEAMGGR